MRPQRIQFWKFLGDHPPRPPSLTYMSSSFSICMSYRYLRWSWRCWWQRFHLNIHNSALSTRYKRRLKSACNSRNSGWKFGCSLVTHAKPRWDFCSKVVQPAKKLPATPRNTSASMSGPIYSSYKGLCNIRLQIQGLSVRTNQFAGFCAQICLCLAKRKKIVVIPCVHSQNGINSGGSRIRKSGLVAGKLKALKLLGRLTTKALLSR